MMLNTGFYNAWGGGGEGGEVGISLTSRLKKTKEEACLDRAQTGNSKRTSGSLYSIIT